MKLFAQLVGHYVEHIWLLELVAEQYRLDNVDRFLLFEFIHAFIYSTS